MVRHSVVVFVSAFLLGAWGTWLAHTPLPDRLASAFTWVGGGIVGVLIVAVVVARRFFGE